MTSFAESVNSYIDANQSLVNTAMPGKILSYDAATQKAVIVPLIQIQLKNGKCIDFAEFPLQDVPVIFSSTSSSAMTFPLKKDDTVLLIFNQRSIDNWLVSKGTDTVVPDDFRKHDLSDAVAIPGFFNFSRAVNNPTNRTLPHETDDLVIAHNINTPNENEFRLKPTGTIEIKAGATSKLTLNKDGTILLDAPTSLTVNTPVANYSGDINATGTITGDVDVIGGGISLLNHTHAGSPTAPSGAVSPTGVPE